MAIMNDQDNADQGLAKRLEALEQRVAELEKRASNQQYFSFSLPPSAPNPVASSSVSPTHGSSLLSLVGKAMLAVAGAYLLRAATAYGAIPQIPLITVAIAYAFAWLIPAARTKAQNHLPNLVWAGTSAVIFLPMIWELTLRFRILSSGSAASVLGLYVIVAALLGWKRLFAELAWITLGSVSLATFALAVATHDLVPFIAPLLVIAAVAEMAAAGREKLQVRPLMAAIADVAIFVLIWIYSEPAASRSVYPAASLVVLLLPAPLLLFLYAASASSQIIRKRRGISIFETAQTLIAFVLTCWSFLVFWSGKAEVVLGALCLVAAAAGYAVSLAWFRRLPAKRNYHVYATGSLALLLMGCFLSLPATWLAISLGIFAIGTSFAASRIRAISLGFHGVAALAAIAVASGQLLWSAKAFAGPLPAAPGGTTVLVATSAALCSVALFQSSFDAAWQSLLRLTLAALGVFASAGLLVWGFVWVGTQLPAAPISLGSQQIAIVRTVVACAFAIGLAWSGSIWQRKELAWLAWPVLALTALKILFEDVRNGHLAFTAISIFLYAVTLLLVSRLIRPRIKTEHS